MAGSVRSDKPILTEEGVRGQRARAILRVFEQATGTAVPSEDRDSTIQWLDRCLMAHEVDTLKLLVEQAR